MREPLADHEHRHHVGLRIRYEEIQVDRLGARTRELLDFCRQVVQLHVHRGLYAAFPEAQVAQCVQRETPLLAPHRALTFNQSCTQPQYQVLLEFGYQYSVPVAN